MSNYTTSLGLEEITPGNQAGLWGNTTNNNLALIDQAIAGVTPVYLDSKSGFTYVLTNYNGAFDEARAAVINVTYSSTQATGANFIEIPSAQKLYVFRNSSGQSITVQTSAATYTVTIANGEATLVFCDGLNAYPGIATSGVGTLTVPYGGTGVTAFSSTPGFVYTAGGTSALTSVSAVSLNSSVAGTLPVANGGTGTTALTSGALVVGNGTSNLGTLSGGASGQVATWNGSQWTAATPAVGAVSSVFGRSGAVTAQSTDYASFYYSSSNPSGFITSSSLTGYAQLSGATFTGSVINQYTPSVTAAGTSQGTATSINADYVYVTSSSAPSAPWNGVILPTAAANKRITILNSGTYSIYIYPPSGGSVDNQSTNVPIVLDSGKQITIVGIGSQWFSNYYFGFATGGIQSYARSGSDGAGSQIKITTFDGTNTGAKYIRVSTYGDTEGALEVIDKTYSLSILSLANNGNFTIGGSIATKPTGTTWSNPSDVRLKDNIQDYTKGLSEITKINPKVWDFNGKGGTTNGIKGMGVIANEIEKVLPDTVDTYKAKLNSEDLEATDIKRFDATEITWLLVNSVKELSSKVDAQAVEIEALKYPKTGA